MRTYQVNLGNVENSRIDFYVTKTDILKDKKKARSRFPECSICGNEVHSRVMLTRCLHPVCIVCAAPHCKESKDYRCPDCNNFEHILSKFYSCLAESQPVNIKAEAEKIIHEENMSKKDVKGRLKGKLDRLSIFDHVGDDLAKVSSYLHSITPSVKT